MNNRPKILTVAIWAVLVFGLLAALFTGWWNRDESTALSSDLHLPAPDFSLVDQNEQPVTRDSLAGQVWIADFIFTTCQGPCPLMTLAMSRVQNELPAGPIRLISFTVDPATDTPAVLKEYARSNGADEQRWLFLTGPADSMRAVARGMNIGITPAAGDEPITHGTHFVLVDKQGQIRGYYSGLDPRERAKLIADAKLLAGG